VSFGYIPVHRGWKRTILQLLGWPVLIRRLQAPSLLSYLELRPTDRLLDLGCGGAHLAFEFSPRCKQVVAVDYVKHDSHDPILSFRSNIEFVYTDVHQLPFVDSSFDRILLSSVVQVVDNDKAVISESARVLSQDGIAVVSVPTEYVFIRKLYDATGNVRTWLSWAGLPATFDDLKRSIGGKFQVRGKQYYSEESFRNLVAPYFTIVKELDAPGIFGSFLFEALLFYRLMAKKKISYTSSRYTVVANCVAGLRIQGPRL
jgi:ubiquinone/menaquinone biosynthesis C-methylase UbiE